MADPRRPGGRLLRRRQTGPRVRARAPERERHLAACGHRARRLPRPGAGDVACDLPRRASRQPDHVRLARHLALRRRRQHARGAPGRDAGESLRARPQVLYPAERHCDVHRSGGGSQHHGEPHRWSDEPCPRRVRPMEGLRKYLAHLVAGGCGGGPDRGAGVGSVEHGAAPTMAQAPAARGRHAGHRAVAGGAHRIRRVGSVARGRASSGAVPVRAVPLLGGVPPRTPRRGHVRAGARLHRDCRHAARPGPLRPRPGQCAAASAARVPRGTGGDHVGRRRSRLAVP